MNALDIDELNRTFIALLTTHVNGNPVEGASMLIDLDWRQLIYIVGMSLGMLAHEIELGCADAKIPVDEYLGILGLAAAGGE